MRVVGQRSAWGAARGKGPRMACRALLSPRPPVVSGFRSFFPPNTWARVEGQRVAGENLLELAQLKAQGGCELLAGNCDEGSSTMDSGRTWLSSGVSGEWGCVPQEDLRISRSPKQLQWRYHRRTHSTSLQVSRHDLAKNGRNPCLVSHCFPPRKGRPHTTIENRGTREFSL